MCVCVCAYVCVYVCMYICVYVCMFVYMCVFVLCVFLCMCVCVDVYVCGCVCLWMCVCVYVCSCVYEGVCVLDMKCMKVRGQHSELVLAFTIQVLGLELRSPGSAASTIIYLPRSRIFILKKQRELASIVQLVLDDFRQYSGLNIQGMLCEPLKGCLPLLSSPDGGSAVGKHQLFSDWLHSFSTKSSHNVMYTGWTQCLQQRQVLRLCCQPLITLSVCICTCLF